MDWNNVSWWEVASALREAEWRQRPPPVSEFLQPNRFSLPKTRAKWSSRAKNNVFYYHFNYSIILCAVLSALFFRQPRAAAALALLALSAATTFNDTIAASLSAGVSSAAGFAAKRTGGRLGWRLSRGNAASTAPASTSLRQPLPGGKGGSQTGRFRRIIRRALSAMLTIVSLYVIFQAAALLRLVTGLVAGGAIVSTHATFRSPNLKARLGSARDEFRALWRGYQEIDTIDYTL